MSAFRDLAEGFFTGFVAAAENFRGGRLEYRVDAMGKIEHLCGQLNWTVDEREEHSFILHFRDPLVQIRRVVVVPRGAGVMVGSASATSIPAEQVRHEILGHLLTRNSELGNLAWQASITQRGTANFCVRSYAFIEGLEAAMFKEICESLVTEVNLFDSKMRAAGLL